MIKEFVSEGQFAGLYYENLDFCFIIYETTAEMCNQTYKKKIESLVTILKDNELEYFTKKANSCHNYEEAKEMLRKIY